MKIELKKIYHKGLYRIALYFEKDKTVQYELKRIGAQWSRTHQCWHLPYSTPDFKRLKSLGYELLLPKVNQEKETQVAGAGLQEIPPIVAEHSHAPPPPIPIWEQDKEVHKSPLVEIARFPQLRLMPSTGKYWVFKLHYREGITQALKKINGVFWNNTHKCFMAAQNSKVRDAVHEVLGMVDFLPEVPPKENFEQLKGKTFALKAHVQNIQWVEVHLPPLAQAIEPIKRMAYSRYSKAGNCYLVPAAPKVIQSVKEILTSLEMLCEDQIPQGYLKDKHMPKRKALELSNTRQSLLSEVPPEAQTYLSDYIDRLMARNFSASTVRTYGSAFARFLRDIDYKDPSEMAEREVIAYLAQLMQRGLRSATGHTLINALKFYYIEVLKRPAWQIDLPRPKREKALPEVLTQEECMLIFKQISNAKHRLILLMAYGSGLRISEVVNLKWGDLLMEQHKIHIKNAKGMKDRMVMLPYSLVESILSYKTLEQNTQANDYVFAGQYAGEPYSTRSVQNIMRKALAQAGLSKKATVHTLRHSFATHLLEQGTDIRYIQGFLGHSSIKTTTIYAHLTQTKVNKISSPLDQMTHLKDLNNAKDK